MNRPVTFVAFALLAVALFLPPESTATFLVDPARPDLQRVVQGVWILKLVVLLNAILLLIGARFAPRSGRFDPLLSRGVRPEEPIGASARWAIGGLLALATVLRLHSLGVGPWFDEIDTYVHYVTRPLGEIVTTFDSQNQHLLYSVLARLATLAIGEGVFALRLPAAVLGVASIWAAWRFARLVADWRESLFVAALLTLSYHHVWFSQNARGYTGLLLFTLLGSTTFLRMLAEEQPRGFRRPLAYGLWMALAVATHATALLAVAAHGLVWLALLWRGRHAQLGPNRWQPGLGFFFAAGLGLGLYALVLPQFMNTLLAPTMPGVATEWKDPLWLIGETLRGLGQGLPGGPVVIVGALVLGALGTLAYARQGPAVLGVLLLGTVLTAAALIGTGHNLWPRMFFFSAAFYVLIGVRGFAEWIRIFGRGPLKPMAGGLLTAVLSLFCLANAATLPRAYGPKQDFQGALGYLEAARRPGDAVVTVDMTVMPFRDFYTAGWSEVDNAEQLVQIEQSHPRTWLVYTTPTRLEAEYPELWAHLQDSYREAQVFWGTVAGGQVVVLESR